MTIQSHKGPYEVRFDEAALDNLDSSVPADAHFIIDDHVADLYAARMPRVLAHRSVLRIEAREENKSLDRFPAYVDHLVGKGIRRDQVLVAMGGGIIQDITCFLAATLLRGVDWVFYPTTLLAQADSCIGSKSSINSGAAKNILGTFTPPRRIELSTAFLDTLDERDVRSGVGEMLKVHAIDGPASFDAIAADYASLFTDRATMVRYIRRALEVKKAYIERDEFDRGPRNIFNYGHSFGHAIEAATDFAVPHGIAVTIGMDMANHLSARLGVGTEANAARMAPPLRANYRGYAGHPVPLDPFLAALSKDKKNVGSGTVTLILPDGEGRVFRDTYANDAAFAGLCRDYLEAGRGA
ncbi:MAG: 3-dehydroquinate synthase [Hyphomicrobiales bacterium]|nr:3-dehydroquinate synthase [Hyphomicrobiales bacterium]MCP5370528.1 3-dehydroquinate synthase [Hyphomicrobiales bacterium]